LSIHFTRNPEEGTNSPAEERDLADGLQPFKLLHKVQPPAFVDSGE